MKNESAGLLMYRFRRNQLEVLIVHPGGPFWKNKDEQAWSIPKGRIDPGENPLEAAQREFKEETGTVPSGPYLELGTIRQKAGKLVYAWAFKGDLDPRAILSNTFSQEWPPHSGKMQIFPEIDRAEFFTPEIAAQKLIPAQVVLIDRLCQILKRE